MKGPKGRFLYKRNMVPRIGMIAGGTGITPCLQVLKSALSDTADKTRFDLLYANVTEDEILLRDEVEALAATHPTRLSVYYFLNVPPAGWTQGTGFITKEAISERLPGPDKSRILMCGPPPMMEAMKKHLAALQFQVPGVISKMEDVRWPHTTDNSKYLLFNLDILYCIRRPSTSESALSRFGLSVPHLPFLRRTHKLGERLGGSHVFSTLSPSTYPRAPTMLADLFAGFITGVLTIVLLAFFGSGDRAFAYHA